MKRILSLSLVVVLALASMGFAGRKHGIQARGGGGGPMVFFYSPDLGPLNTQAEAMGLPKFDGYLKFYGGGGGGFIGKHLKIGGMGAGGIISTNGNVFDDTLGVSLNKEVSLSIGFGGVTLEYVQPFLERLEVSFGGLLAWGEVTLEVNQKSGPNHWDGLWNNYHHNTTPDAKNITTQMDNGLFIIKPWVEVKYYITEWFALGGNLGYFYCSINKNNWKSNDVKINDVPKIDLSQVMFGVNFFFGG